MKRAKPKKPKASRPKFSISSYTITVRHRDWSACQENRDDYTYEDETRYAINCNGKDLARGFSSHMAALEHLRAYYSIHGLKRQMRELKKETKATVRELKSRIKAKEGDLKAGLLRHQRRIDWLRLFFKNQALKKKK